MKIVTALKILVSQIKASTKLTENILCGFYKTKVTGVKN